MELHTSETTMSAIRSMMVDPCGTSAGTGRRPQTRAGDDEVASTSKISNAAARSLGRSPSAKGKRVVAEQHLRPAPRDKNFVRRLMSRETDSRCTRMFNRTDSQERFHNMRLQHEYDTHAAGEPIPGWRDHMMRRTKIVEIVACHDLVITLAHSGVCTAFDRADNKRICYLNVDPQEEVKSLFYNKNNRSIIQVSVYASDGYTTLKCRSTPIECIRRGRPQDGSPLFEEEELRYPGFVEFDDVNGKVLTYSHIKGSYKVHNLQDYRLLYTIEHDDIKEIKISPGVMLVIHEQQERHVLLKILDIENGQTLKQFKHSLHPNKRIDFIEQFNEKLLVKQADEKLQIMDVRSGGLIEVDHTDFIAPSAFIFLYENQLFLTFKQRTVAVWNFRGELVTSFEDHMLWHPECNTNNMYITSEQDLIISYCRADKEALSCEGSINVSHILTGKRLAKIQIGDACEEQRAGKRQRRSLLCAKAALEDVTALFYDEDRGEIYTGNRLGFVHVWSN